MDGVATITLARPERRNAIGSELTSDLEAAFSDADKDLGCGAIVLTGMAPGFCAGSDLKELAGLTIDQMVEHEAAAAAMVRRIPLLAKPVVAAVEGFALGGGLLLAAACDVVVTAKDVRWHLPEVPLGWLPPWGLRTLAARLSPSAARLLTYAGAPVDGSEAVRLGLADRVVANGDARQASVEMARQLAALPMDARESTKRYFAKLVASNAEAEDETALQVFAQNCRSSAAHLSLSKFGLKP